MQEIRIGQGYDAHRFVDATDEPRPLILGGVAIPHDRGLAAHSDGDVLIHALCDALLGAIAAGDIGKHFPDTDPAYQNADSARLLQHVVALLGEQGWTVANVDATVLAQTPRLAPYVMAIRQRLAALLLVDVDRVSIKASTTEGMGFVGRREGIAVHANALVQR